MTPGITLLTQSIGKPLLPPQTEGGEAALGMAVFQSTAPVGLWKLLACLCDCLSTHMSCRLCKRILLQKSGSIFKTLFANTTGQSCRTSV